MDFNRYILIKEAFLINASCSGGFNYSSLQAMNMDDYDFLVKVTNEYNKPK
jgi:hypothetical protein